MKIYRTNGIIAGALFIITMMLGMFDASSVQPHIEETLQEITAIGDLLVPGAMAVFGMAIGIVGIALALFPVVKRQSETIAQTYLAFRF